MPITAAPQITASKERIEIGKPEKGVRITMMPIRRRVLARDIELV